MKRAVVVLNLLKPHIVAWCGAFAEGLMRHGFDVTISEHASAADLVVLWGTRNREAVALQKNIGGEICVLERGYIGDRFKWSSVSFGGGLNGRATFSGPFQDSTRWNKNFSDLMRPWRRIDGYALLIGQLQGDESIKHVNIQDWYRDTVEALQKAGWPVRFRQHPGAIERGHPPPQITGVPVLGGALHEAFGGAGLVVTFNSNTGVESVLAGCPTLTMDPGAMAWPVTGHDVDSLITPDRNGWAQAMAWKQWTIDEIAYGACWDAVKPDCLC